MQRHAGELRTSRYAHRRTLGRLVFDRTARRFVTEARSFRGSGDARLRSAISAGEKLNRRTDGRACM